MESFSGVHCFDGKAYVFYSAFEEVDDTYCKLVAYSKSELESFTEIKLISYE